MALTFMFCQLQLWLAKLFQYGLMLALRRVCCTINLVQNELHASVYRVSAGANEAQEHTNSHSIVQSHLLIDALHYEGRCLFEVDGPATRRRGPLPMPASVLQGIP